MITLPDLEPTYQETFNAELNAWFDRGVSRYADRDLFTVVASAAMLDESNVAPEFARLRGMIAKKIGETFLRKAIELQLEAARALGWDAEFCLHRITVYPPDSRPAVVLRWQREPVTVRN